MQLFSINGTYGSQNTPTTVFCATDNNGLTWYVCEGGQTVNATYDQLTDGVNVEELHDCDCFTVSPVESLEDLETAIDL